jgi:adenosylmethionine-8-amino-7-oxononanoate aminotransferase
MELRSSTGGYLDDIAPKLTYAFVKRGLLLRPMGNILYFMPPYVITESEVDWVFDQIEEVLHQLS